MLVAQAQHKGLLARLAGLEPSATPDPRIVLTSIGQAVYDWNLATDRLTWTGDVAAVLGVDAAAVATGAAFAALCDGGTSRHDAVSNAAEPDRGTGVRFAAGYGFSGGAAPLWIDECGRWFAAPDGRPIRAHGVIRAVPQAAAPMTVPLDPLTGLPGRREFETAVARRCADTGRDTVPFAILLVTETSIESENRQHGHAAGDRALLALSGRLRGLLRSADTLARYGGATFGLLLDRADAAAAKAAAGRIRKAGSALRIGIATTTDGAPTRAAALCREAERALAADSKPKRARTRKPAASLQMALLDQLNGRTFALALTPCVATATGQPALWMARPTLGDDDAALAPLLDWRSLEQAAARLAADPALHLALPLSPSFFADPTGPDRLRDAFAFDPAPAGRLTVVADERDALSNLDTTAAWMTALRQHGVRIALAGGAGANPHALRVLKPDLLVIDGAFVQALTRSPDNRFLVRAILDMAQQLGIATLAPWVDGSDIAALLTGWGVTYQAGTLFSAAELARAAAAA